VLESRGGSSQVPHCVGGDELLARVEGAEDFVFCAFLEDVVEGFDIFVGEGVFLKCNKVVLKAFPNGFKFGFFVFFSTVEEFNDKVSKLLLCIGLMEGLLQKLLLDEK
jgi:hypothetical protein